MAAVVAAAATPVGLPAKGPEIGRRRPVRPGRPDGALRRRSRRTAVPKTTETRPDAAPDLTLVVQAGMPAPAVLKDNEAPPKEAVAGPLTEPGQTAPAAGPAAKLQRGDPLGRRIVVLAPDMRLRRAGVRDGTVHAERVIRLLMAEMVIALPRPVEAAEPAAAP